MKKILLTQPTPHVNPVPMTDHVWYGWKHEGVFSATGVRWWFAVESFPTAPEISFVLRWESETMFAAEGIELPGGWVFV